MILGNLARRSTLENPSQSLRDFFLDDGAESFTGRTVNEKTALTYTAFWACVRYLSNSLAMPPLKVYRRDGRARFEVRDHRNWSLLHDRPNPEMSSFQWRETGMGHCLTWGNFYCERELDGNGRTIALWPLRPDRVSVVRQGGVKFLAVQEKTGEIVKVPPDRYLHIAGPGYDGTVGYSVVAQIKQAIGLGLSAEENGARFYGGGGRVPFVVTSPLEMKPEAQERFRKAWEQTHGSQGEGLRKSHRVAVLDQGMSVQQIGLSNEDNQFLETRAFQVEEMARAMGVPQHKIQLLQNADFSNIEKQAIEAVTDAVMPWAIRWEQTLNWVLFSEVERRSLYAEFLLDVLLRGDAEARAAALKTQREWGIINADEWREKENMNPLPNGQGEAYLVPLNMVDAASLGEEVSTDEPPDDRGETRSVEQRALRSATARFRLHAAYVKLFQRAAEHFVTHEARAALRILKKAFESAAPVEDLIRLLEEFYRTFSDSVIREMFPVILAMSELIRQEIESETGSTVAVENLERFSAQYVQGYADRHIGSSMGQVRKLVEETPAEELRETLSQRFTEWGDRRFVKIATNESVRAGNALAMTAYGLVGVAFLVWRTIGGNCPLCDQMNGRRVVTGAPFLNKGDGVVPDDDKTATLVVRSTTRHPPLHRGCDCVIGAG